MNGSKKLLFLLLQLMKKTTIWLSASFILRILEVSSPSNDLIRQVKNFIIYTDTRMKSLEVGQDEPWLYTSKVQEAAMEKTLHPLTTLQTKLAKIQKLASTCLQCSSAAVQHYCRGCLVAVYCSQECRLQHLKGGHQTECDVLAAGIFGQAGLALPAPDPSPQVQAANLARWRAEGRARGAMDLYLEALCLVEEMKEKKEELEAEIATKEEKIKEQMKETAYLAS